MVYQYWDIIPEGEDLEDLSGILYDLYLEYQELIEDCHDEYGLEEYGHEYICHVDGILDSSFVCFRIPGIYYFINTDRGSLNYISYVSWNSDSYFGPMGLELLIYIGVWAPPCHNGYNYLTRVFYGFTYLLYYDFG